MVVIPNPLTFGLILFLQTSGPTNCFDVVMSRTLHRSQSVDKVELYDRSRKSKFIIPEQKSMSIEIKRP